jgi:hypothetical protein
VVGVVSFVSAAGLEGSSKMQANFANLFLAACNAQPGNCTSSQGAAIASR